MKQIEKAGLVLEGGGVRGLFTSGILDYLMEKQMWFEYVIGVSAGACNALDYVSEQPTRTRDCMMPPKDIPDYRNHNHIWKRKSLLDLDMVFDQYPNEILPFDYDTYFHSPIRSEMVVTNCLTGKAEYLDERQDKKRLMDICRASSSLPFISPMVSIDGNSYLDGGLADSIPIRRALTSGYKKNVVILTRNAGYRKSFSKRGKRAYIAAYGKYPNIVKAMYYRAERYNKTLDLIESLEKEGRVFVIRPELPAVSKLEKNRQVLLEFYQHGYEYMKQQYEKLEVFLATSEKKTV